ncbi:ATP-grasp fold amidoligase family protein [Roseivirga echinicomitans]
MVNFFKRIYNRRVKDSFIGVYSNKIFAYVYRFYLSLLSDEAHAKIIFNDRMSYPLNLSNPQTLNEKIQWLKLNERTPLQTKCADKIAVRDYVREKIGDKYLIRMLYRTKNPKDLVQEKLPKEPFIIKTNHASSQYKVVLDKGEVEWAEEQRKFQKWLKVDLYKERREWQYGGIAPEIMVEELLISNNGGVPNDYKFHCFNGVVKFIQVDVGRGSLGHYRNYYFTDWSIAPFAWSSVFKDGKATDPSSLVVPKPDCLDEMIELSEKLSSDFRYVRIDLYECYGQVFFGEFTFHHDGGFRPILPVEYDFKLGAYLSLK